MTELSLSKRNEIELQRKYGESTFNDLKFFVPPNIQTSVEDCTAEALLMFDELLALQNGEIEPEAVYSSES